MRPASRWFAAALAAWIGFAGAASADSPAIWIQINPPTDEQYDAIQGAFLGEQFDRVIELAGPLLSESPDRVDGPSPKPWLLGRTARVWLWYSLSLERLARTTEALREIDRLKSSILEASDIPAVMSLRPEVLFWEGEISRKSLQMGRARLAYQRLLDEFPTSSWKPRAQLGLAFTHFHQQDYDTARQQAREVAEATPNTSLARQAMRLEAICNLQQKRYPTALDHLDQLLAQVSDPTWQAQLTFYRGEALSGMQRFADATESYQRVIDASPGSLWARLARFGLGWSQFQEHRCGDALATLGADASPDPAWPKAELLFMQGRCAMDQRDEARALTAFQELRRAFPDHPLTGDALVSLSELLERQRRYGEAQAILEPMLKTGAPSAQLEQARLRLGSLLLAQSKPTEAQAQFEAMQQSEDPLLRQAALNGQGDVQLFLTNYADAEKWYRDAQQIDPKSHGAVYASYQLGQLKLHTGEAQEAIDMFGRVLEQPDSTLAVDARLGLGVASLTAGQNEQAATELARVRTEAPGTVQAARAGYYLGFLAANSGRADEAKALCEEVIAKSPQSSEAFEARMLLAELAAAAGSIDEALAGLRSSVGPDAAMTDAQRGKLARKLGDLARQAGRYEDAIAGYEIARQAIPAQQAEIDYLLASCYEEAGDIPMAVSRYQAIEGDPWRIRGQLAAAKLLERDDKLPEAMEIYQRVMRQPIPEAKIAEERLAALRAQPKP